MKKRIVISGLVVLLVMVLIGSFGLAMGKKPAQEQAVSKAETEENIEIAEVESKPAKTTEEKVTIEEMKVYTEEYVPRVIIEAKWGSGPGELGLSKEEMSGDHIMPNCIEVDKEGNVYIMDPANERILKFNKDGEYKRTIDLEPTGFSISEIEKLYIPEQFSMLKKLGLLDRPRSLTEIRPGVYIGGNLQELKIDEDGNIYIRTSAHSRSGYSPPILKFSQDGKFLYEYILPEGKYFRNLYLTEKGEVIVDTYKRGRYEKREKKKVKLTPLGIAELNPEINEKIETEERLKNERIKKIEFKSELSKKGYVLYYYSEIIGEDKESNLYVRVEAENPDVKKNIIQIYKYNPEGRLLSIFGEREEIWGTHKFAVAKDGVVYELLIPVKGKKLTEPKSVFSSEGELLGYTHREYIFPEYVKVIKWEKKR